MYAGNFTAPASSPDIRETVALFARVATGEAAFYDQGGNVLALCPLKPEIKAKTGFIAWLKNLLGFGDKEAVRRSLPVSDPQKVATAIAHYGNKVQAALGRDPHDLGTDAQTLLERHARLPDAASPTAGRTRVASSMFGLFQRIVNEKAVAQAIGHLVPGLRIAPEELAQDAQRAAALSKPCTKETIEGIATDWIAKNPAVALKHRVEQLYQGLPTAAVEKSALLATIASDLREETVRTDFQAAFHERPGSPLEAVDAALRPYVRYLRANYLKDLLGTQSHLPKPAKLTLSGPDDSLRTLIGSPLRDAEIRLICTDVERGVTDLELDELVKNATARDRQGFAAVMSAGLRAAKDSLTKAVKAEGPNSAKSVANQAVLKIRDERLAASAAQALREPTQQAAQAWIESIGRINRECFDTYYAGYYTASQRLARAKLPDARVDEIRSHLGGVMDQFHGDAATRLKKTMGWVEAAISAAKAGQPITGAANADKLEVNALQGYGEVLAQDVRVLLFGEGEGAPAGGILASTIKKLKDGGYDRAIVDEMAGVARKSLMADFSRDLTAPGFILQAAEDSTVLERLHVDYSVKIQSTMVEMLQLRMNEKTLGTPSQARAPQTRHR